MSNNAKPYYLGFFDHIRKLRTTDPEKARQKLREDGIWLFYEAIEANDLKTAHQVLDWGVFKDFEAKRKPECWLHDAWHRFPCSHDAQKRTEFVAELREMESCMRFAGHWDAMLGLAVALQDKNLVWKYAQKGGRVRQWGKPGEKWTIHRLLRLTEWEDVRNSYRARCFFDDWGLEYEIMLAELVYDTMKQLAPSVADDDGKCRLRCENPEAELVFRPIMEHDGQLWLECSFCGADACPFCGPVFNAPSWERVLGMKVDCDFAGMFAPGELVGAMLADYASEFGLGSRQIRDRRVRRSFAARLGALYRKHPRPTEDKSL